MRLQPSASKAALLLECSYPFSVDLPPDPGGEAADYGSAFHELLALGIKCNFAGHPTKKEIEAAAKKWECFAPELETHYNHAWPVLEKWLSGDNHWREDFTAPKKSNRVEVEVSMAVSPTGGRRIAPPTPDGHRYEEALPGEIPGTADLIIYTSRFVLVMDHKTGSYGDFSTPATNPQLLTLASGLQIRASQRPVLAIFHAPRGGDAIIHAEAVSLSDISYHREKLFDAQAKIGDGSMRPGKWCRYCPARDVCPTRDVNLAEAITVAGGIMKAPSPSTGIVTAEKIGKLHLLREEVDRASKKAQEMIRAWVRTHPTEVAVRPDGKELVIKSSTRESISKESILEALGPIKGAKELDRLRKLGCIKSTEREELKAE